MNDLSGELTIQALSRPAYIGQLYNAASGTLLNESLFDLSKIVTQEQASPKTEFDYKEAKSLQERADTLNVSASLSISILSGAVNISGFGSYLDRKEDTSDSTTIAAYAHIRTKTESIDVYTHQGAVRLGTEQVESVGATHVVTSITFGGNVVGLFTQKKSESESERNIHGKFSADILKGMGKFLEVSGSAELKMKEKEKLENYNLEVRLLADFHVQSLPLPKKEVPDEDKETTDDKEDATAEPEEEGSKENDEAEETAEAAEEEDGQELALMTEGSEPEMTDSTLPTTAPELITTVVHSKMLIGDKGVPCDIHLTPLTRFKFQLAKMSALQELEQEELLEIRGVYDRFITLEQNRSYLRSQMDEHYRSFFPSFTADCRERATQVTLDLQEARKGLRTYLEDYRNSAEGVLDVEEFLSTTRTKYDTAQTQYETDQAHFDGLLEKKSVADKQKFKLVSAVQLKKMMNRTDDATIALIIIPETVGKVSLLNAYRVLADEIREWREAEDGKREEKDKTIYVSIYADPKIDDDLKLLDGSNENITSALKHARDNEETTFLTFGVGLSKFGELEWNALNKDGWGTLSSKEEKWHYIGEVKDGERHGSGVITYSGDTRYTGMWTYGRRDGNGKLLNTSNGTTISEGVWVDDTLRADGIVIEATVFKNDVPVNFAPIAFRSGDALRTHVAKIAEIFDWKSGEKYKVCLENQKSLAFVTSTVYMDGALLDSSQGEDVANAHWLSEEGKKVLKAYAMS
ncbi:hypothetical protein AX17_005389 [Amanita inopinata Kibby_2008]|nr:hypothetical protein AX17_005389 [Amanita inopinata Kibby_2008]